VTAAPGSRPARESLAWRELRLDIEAFNAEYAAVLDDGRLEDWPELFAEDAVYAVIARENEDAGLPAGLVYSEGKGMLRDRAFAIAHTAMFAPRYLRHYITNARVLGQDDGVVAAGANYLVLQTLVDAPTTILQAGRYRDRFIRAEDGRLLLKERRCIYDSLLIDNALVLPV
jgi:3-phenylpropionate/cinnamic acid dioxygenase small subunit